MKEIKCIFFDIGNVLMKPIHGEILDNIKKQAKVDVTTEMYRSRISSVLNKSFLGEITLEETWEGLFGASGVTDTEIQNDIKANYEVSRNDALISFIRKISSNWRIGIISDLSQIGYYTFTSNYRDLLEVLDPSLLNFSLLQNKSKRSHGSEWFGEILEKAGIDAADALFIDDEDNNLKSATDIGINCIKYSIKTWSESNKELFSELREYGIG